MYCFFGARVYRIHYVVIVNLAKTITVGFGIFVELIKERLMVNIHLFKDITYKNPRLNRVGKTDNEVIPLSKLKKPILSTR